MHVAPDYVAAFLAAPPDSDLCIVAGTGSVVCSRAVDGSFLISGGRGWILGDHGGAARLGQAALEHYVADAQSVPAPFAAAVRAQSATVTGARSSMPSTPRRTPPSCWPGRPRC